MQLMRTLGTAALRGGLFVFPLASAAVAAGAQSRADSIPLTFGVWVPRSQAGVAVGTIDSADARGSAGAPPRTFSDLLTARLAGVSVSRTSGFSGAAARVLLRGRNHVGGDVEPMLVVDGIVASGESAADGPIVSGAPASRLDEIAPEDIERVDVLRGPAATSLYGVNASNGVIVVTTRRGSAGRLRMQSFAEAGAAEQGSAFDASYWRFGQTTVGNPARCTLLIVAAGECTPDSLVTRSSFARQDPFRVAPRVAAGASGAWGGPVAAYRLSGRFENEQGPMEPNGLRRFIGRATVSSHPVRSLDLSFSGGLVDGTIDLPAEADILRRYMADAPAGASPMGYSELAESFYDTPVRQDARRLSWGARAAWQPLGWLQAFASYGRDGTARDDSRALSYSTALTGSTGSLHTDQVKTRRAETGFATAALGAAATFHPAPSLEAVTLVGAHRVRRRASWQAADSGRYTSTPGDGSSYIDDALGGEGTVGVSKSRRWDRMVTTGLYAQQRLSWRDRFSFGAGVMRAAVTNEYASPLDVDGLFPSADAAWTVRDAASVAASSSAAWLGAVRLRAAAGETPHALSYDDIRETIRWYPAGDPPPAGAFVPWRFERTREGELGMDADLFGSRAGVELTWHRSLSRSLLLIDRSGYPRPIADQSGRSRTSGVEGRLFGQILERPGFRWDASLALSARSQHMLGPSIPLWSQPNFGVREQPESGYPIGALWVLPYSFADANGDGIIAYEELSLPNGIGGYVYRGPVDPTREAALQSTLRLRRGVQLSALVDHRGGMWKVNATGIQRCWYKACRAAQDPATPLDEQARAVLAMYGGGALGFVEDASFTKLREVAVAFDAPARWAAAVGAGSLRVTVAGRNLATWSSYGGPDPEVGSGGTLFPGAIDEFTQPLPRYFTARLTANW